MGVPVRAASGSIIWVEIGCCVKSEGKTTSVVSPMWMQPERTKTDKTSRRIKGGGLAFIKT